MSSDKGEIADLRKEVEYMKAKMYQRDDDEVPDMDIVATLTRHNDGITPKFIPVDQRLVVIPIRVNGVKLAGLIDTGSSLTLAPRSIAGVVKAKLMPGTNEIRSVTGHTEILPKKSIVRLEIVGHRQPVEINFTEGDGLGLRNVYDVLIGNDALKQFLPITVDIMKRTFAMGGKVISMRTTGELLREPRKVFAMQNIVIPAESERIVNALVDKSMGKVMEQMTVEGIEGSEYDTVETLTRVGVDNECKVVVRNRTANDIRIDRRTIIGQARNVIEKGELLANYPEITAAMVNMADKGVRDPVAEADPTYVIDYGGCEIDSDKKEKLEKLTLLYSEAFSKNGYDLGYARVEPIGINTTTEIPPKPTIYATHRGQRDEVSKHIEWMKKAGCIVESRTHWLSPIVMVKKKSGEMRPCIDLRKLNEITIPDHYPLPKVQDALDIVGGKSWYSKIDLSKGFWQLPLRS